MNRNSTDTPWQARRSPPSIRRSTPTPSQISDITIISPGLPEEHQTERRQIIQSSGPARSPVSPPPITTTVPPVRDWSATPRAQTRPEAEAAIEQPRSTSQQRPSNLEGTFATEEEARRSLNIGVQISRRHRISSKPKFRLLAIMAHCLTKRSSASKRRQMKSLHSR